MARSAVASMMKPSGFRRPRTDDRRQKGRKVKSYLSSVLRPPSSDSPPQAATVGGLDLAVIGRDRAVERAVERGQHAALDEVEGGRLAVARGRQGASDLAVDATGGRAHPHEPGRAPERLPPRRGDPEPP